MFFNKLVLVAAFLTLAPHAGAAFGVDFWRDADGLSQSRIRNIAQTRDGYLWLATDGGLVRFNGTSFRAFTTETGDLKDNEVWALQEDNEGGLWIGTYGGGLTLMKDGRFRTFTTAQGLPDDVVMSLAKDRAGDLWMITPQGPGHYSHGVFTRPGPSAGLADVHVLGMCGQSLYGPLFATRAGVYRYADGRFSPLPLRFAESGGAPEHMLCASDGSLWFGFSTGAVERHREGELSVFKTAAALPQQITRLYEDPHGVVWTARGTKLARFRNGTFEPVPFEAGSADLGNVYSLFMDLEGSLWAGLQSNGLARLRTRPISSLSVDDGLPDDRARSVFQDSRGDVWIGTAEGLSRFSHKRATSWTRYNGERLGDVRALAEDAAGNLWLSAGKDLLIMRHDRLTSAPGWKGRFEIEALYNDPKDPKGGLWIGTDGAGLYHYADGVFTNFLSGTHVRDILKDRDGAVWVSVFGTGVVRYANGSFSSLTPKDGLAGDRVVAMLEDEEGALWFATRHGLSRFKNGRFFTWTSEAGLFVSFVYTIVDDGQGSFWFSSAQGIFRVPKSELRAVADGKLKTVNSVVYGVRDGLRTRAGNLGNQPAAWKTQDGRLLFSSMRGVAVVDPANLTRSGLVPPVYIEKVLLNRRDTSFDKDIHAARGAGEIEIHYAALGYSSPEKLRFRYMLEGVDPDWVDAGSRTFTYYANVAPGRYRFRVVAGNSDGAWNLSGASFGFYLQPPFYRTWQFLALLTATAFVLAWLLYKLHMRTLKLRYSAVLAERNRISRDLHDTLAQNLAGIALQLDSVNMHLPESEAELRGRLGQACDLTRYSLAEARRAISDLRSDELDTRDLSEALPEIAARAALETRVRITGVPRKLNPVMEKNLLRIYQEALANAVKHAQAGSVDIELAYSAEALALRVHDDGCGFNVENAALLGDGHFGLLGMRERAERIGGHLTLKSRPGGGTELLVEVPL